MIARFDLGHSGPHLFNHAGPFVSEHGRERARGWDRQILLPAGQIRVADAGGGDANQHFIVVGLADFQLFNAEFP